jgi:ankyrin repeat protein
MLKAKKIIIIMTLFFVFINCIGYASNVEVSDWADISFEEAKKIISGGYDVNQKDALGNEPLYWAASFNDDIKIVKLLINNGADVINESKYNDNTPLEGAVSNDYNIIKLLLENGADATINNKLVFNRTALHIASIFSHNPDTIKLLLDYGADPTIRDDKNNLAFHYLADNENLYNTEAYSLLKKKTYKDISKITNPDEYVFRKVRWGMSKKEVKSQEFLDIDFEADDFLVYETKIANFDVTLYYNFINNKLVGALYYFNIKHSNRNLYIDDFNKLKGLLTKKYKKPLYDDKVWKDDLYKDNPNDYGLAIAIGDLIYRAEWDVSGSIIFLMLSGDNYDISLSISYQSLRYKKLKDKTKTKETLDNF